MANTETPTVCPSWPCVAKTGNSGNVKQGGRRCTVQGQAEAHGGNREGHDLCTSRNLDQQAALSGQGFPWSEVACVCRS